MPPLTSPSLKKDFVHGLAARSVDGVVRYGDETRRSYATAIGVGGGAHLTLASPCPAPVCESAPLDFPAMARFFVPFRRHAFSSTKSVELLHGLE
jgi:hypothetical protein